MPEVNTEKSDLKYLITDNPPSGGKKALLWIRTVIFDVETKTICVSSGIGGDLQAILLNVMCNGVPYRAHHNHLYVPITFMVKEFPETARTCSRLKYLVRKWIKMGMKESTR